MGADEFHQYAAERVGYVRDQPVFVAAEVEDQSVVADEIDGGAELAFDVGGRAPVRLADDRKPDANRPFRRPVALPELDQRPAGDHLHKGKIARHQNGDKSHQDGYCCGIVGWTERPVRHSLSEGGKRSPPAESENSFDVCGGLGAERLSPVYDC